MIDSNEATAYDNGIDSGYYSGYEDGRNDMKEIIESMAYEIAQYRKHGRDSYVEDIDDIMKEIGYRK